MNVRALILLAIAGSRPSSARRSGDLGRALATGAGNAQGHFGRDFDFEPFQCVT